MTDLPKPPKTIPVTDSDGPAGPLESVPGELDPEFPDEDAAPTDYEQQLAELNDRYLRLLAEFDNFRKRSKRESERLQVAERERVLGDWLEAVDSVERALSTPVGSRRDDWHRGLEAIHRQMLKILARYDVHPMDSTGKPFDPELHEAISTMQAPGVPANTVFHTERRGYQFKDGRLLRPAQVVVAR